jgi:hypothetical protein
MKAIIHLRNAEKIKEIPKLEIVGVKDVEDSLKALFA